MTGRKATLYLTFLFFPYIVYGLEINSYTDADKIAIDNHVTLTISISGSGSVRSDDPELEPTPEFVVYSSGTSQEMSFINGQTSVSKIYSYILKPLKTGIFTIGTAKLKAGGKVYKITGKKIEVISTPATVKQDNSSNLHKTKENNIFVQNSASNNSPYVGEQLTLTFEFFNRLPYVSNPNYIPPDYTGFWVVDLPRTQPSRKIVNGVSYEYSSIKTALFPTSSGTYVISPAKLRYTYGGLFGPTHDQTLSTDPLTIRVKPLPAKNKPLGFTGAVGNFEIALNKDKAIVKTGEMVIVTVTITGTGNLDMVDKVITPDFSAFKSFDPKIKEQRSYNGFIVGGSKTYEFILMPTNPGEINVGEFKFSFFNPADDKYHTVSTQPFSIETVPGSLKPDSSADENYDSTAPSISDIMYIKPDKQKFAQLDKDPSSVILSLLYLLPSFLLIGTILYKKRDKFFVVLAKKKTNAYVVARNKVDQARKELQRGNSSECCSILDSAITGYVCHKLGIDNLDLTNSILTEHITASAIPRDLSERISKELKFLEFVRFSSSGQARGIEENMIKETTDILESLRKVVL